MSEADLDSRPIDGEPLRQSQVIRCEHCDQPVGDQWVYVQAISLARRLYQLDVCGVCWDMLLAAIRLEIAGAGPGGHREAPSPTSSPAPSSSAWPPLVENPRDL